MGSDNQHWVGIPEGEVLQVGDVGLTSDGRPYRVICTDVAGVGDRCVIALVTDKCGREWPLACGRCGSNGGRIFLAPPERLLRPRSYIDVDPAVWRMLPRARWVTVDRSGVRCAHHDRPLVCAFTAIWAQEGEYIDGGYVAVHGDDWTKWIAERPEGV